MSGSDMDDLVEDQMSLAQASRENFDEETEVQLMEDDGSEPAVDVQTEEPAMRLPHEETEAYGEVMNSIVQGDGDTVVVEPETEEPA